LIISASIIIGGILFFNYLNKNVPKTQSIESIEVFSAENITTDAEGLKKYDRYIEEAINIKGKLKEIKKDKEKHTLILSSKNETVTIICKMQKDQIKKINNLQIGKTITIKGIYKGYLIDMILLNCIII